MHTFDVKPVMDKFVIELIYNHALYVFRYAYPTYAKADHVCENLRSKFDDNNPHTDIAVNYLIWDDIYISDKPNENGNFFVHRRWVQ